MKDILSTTVGTYGEFSDRLIKLCLDYCDIFKLKNDKLTVNNFYSQKLSVTDDKPVYVKNYRIPYSQKNEISSQVNELLKNDMKDARDKISFQYE